MVALGMLAVGLLMVGSASGYTIAPVTVKMQADASALIAATVLPPGGGTMPATVFDRLAYMTGALHAVVDGRTTLVLVTHVPLARVILMCVQTHLGRDSQEARGWKQRSRGSQRRRLPTALW